MKGPGHPLRTGVHELGYCRYLHGQRGPHWQLVMISFAWNRTHILILSHPPGSRGLGRGLKSSLPQSSALPQSREGKSAASPSMSTRLSNGRCSDSELTISTCITFTGAFHTVCRLGAYVQHVFLSVLTRRCRSRYALPKLTSSRLSTHTGITSSLCEPWPSMSSKSPKVCIFCVD